MALAAGDLVLCAGTLARASFEERIEAALAGGFAGLSLFGSDYRRARASGLGDGDMRRLLADAGLEVAELDPLMSWVPGFEPPALDDTFAGSEDEFYAIAQALGARSLNAILAFDTGLPRPAIAEAFAALCDRAAAHELLVHLEFMPWTEIGNVHLAAEVVALADRPNGGLMLDSWHHFRSGVPNAELEAKVPIERILAVQLNDAPAQAEDDLVAETLRRRRLPGDGDIDLRDLGRILREGGSPAPLGVEIFAEELFDLAPAEVGRRVGDATRDALGVASAVR